MTAEGDLRVRILGKDADAVYRVDVSEYQGLRTLQLVIEHWEPAR